MKYTSILGIMSVLLLGGIAPASAAVIVTNTNTAPTTDIVLEQVPAGAFNFNYAWGNTYELGQSFYTTDALSITSLTISFATFQSPGALSKPFTLNIYKTTSASEAPSPGSLLTTQAGNLPASLTANTFLTFTLEAPVLLDSNEYYIFMLVSSTPSSTVNIPLYATDSFADNSFTWYKDTGDYGRYTTRSMTMYLQGTVIPEPSTVMLLMSALGMLTLFRRRNGIRK